MKKYGEAEKIKAQADALEEWERDNKEKEVSLLSLYLTKLIDRGNY